MWHNMHSAIKLMGDYTACLLRTHQNVVVVVVVADFTKHENF